VGHQNSLKKYTRIGPPWPPAVHGECIQNCAHSSRGSVVSPPARGGKWTRPPRPPKICSLGGPTQGKESFLVVARALFSIEPGAIQVSKDMHYNGTAGVRSGRKGAESILSDTHTAHLHPVLGLPDTPHKKPRRRRTRNRTAKHGALIKTDTRKITGVQVLLCHLLSQLDDAFRQSSDELSDAVPAGLLSVAALSNSRFGRIEVRGFGWAGGRQLPGAAPCRLLTLSSLTSEGGMVVRRGSADRC